MTLGKTIKQLRKETFLSQEQLAAKLDITAQAVSKWENEESYPDILFLPKIAAILVSRLMNSLITMKKVRINRLKICWIMNVTLHMRILVNQKISYYNNYL